MSGLSCIECRPHKHDRSRISRAPPTETNAHLHGKTRPMAEPPDCLHLTSMHHHRAIWPTQTSPEPARP